MKAVSRFASVAVAALALASTAGAQNISFSTQGFFTGAGCTVTGSASLATTNYCSNGTGGLYFIGTTQNAVGAANTQYGQLATFGTFNPTGTSLTLRLTQTTPAAAPNFIDITGTFTGAFSPGSGFPAFTPNITSFALGGVNYTINVDNNGRINIDTPPVGSTYTGGAPVVSTPGAGTSGNTSDPKSITGTVSTVPEPSTYALMAAGLAGLGLVARRRRTA